MRLWHVKLLPYIPDRQLKGQLREVIAIMHNWKLHDDPKSLIVNKVKDYPKEQLTEYFLFYCHAYYSRFGKHIKDSYIDEFLEFGDYDSTNFISKDGIFKNWHDIGYLKICMTNLFEKYAYAKGKTKLTDFEWERLLEGYKNITGEEFSI